MVRGDNMDFGLDDLMFNTILGVPKSELETALSIVDKENENENEKNKEE